MKVSLTKQTYKVDLSKPPLEKEVREYTPEHLIDEVFLNQPLKAYTPEHICEEVMPERVCTPKHIKAEQIPREKVVSTKPQHHEIPAVDGKDILIIVVSVIAVVVVICLCIFVLGQEPSENTSTIESVEYVSATISDVFAMAEKIFVAFVDSNLFAVLLLLVAIATCINVIRRLFNMRD